MAGHFREVCQFGTTHSQCRCPSPNKEIRTIKCPSPHLCSIRGETAPAVTGDIHDNRETPVLPTMVLNITEKRTRTLLRFALRRFVSDAHHLRNEAAQDKECARFRPGAVEAFSRDIADAEAILARIPE